jgi:hypothetical protein
MVDINLLARPFPPQSTSIDDELRRAVRGVENDAMVRQIAARMAAPRERKHTKTYIRPLAFPVFVKGEACTCAVQEHFIAHPRQHQVETHWFSSIAAAREAFPQAQLMEDVERVQPGLGRA